MPSHLHPSRPPSAVRTRLFVTLLIVLWYLSSSIAVLTTKALFSGLGHQIPPFPFALALTASNNVVASLASCIFSTRTQHAPADEASSRIAFIVGATTAAEIGLSNIALNLWSVSFSTVLKGMAPFFVLAWGIVLRIHTLRLGVAVSLFAIAAGLVLAVTGEHKNINPALSYFLRIGFLAQLVSALFSGFRWVLTQIFIKGEALVDERITIFLKLRSSSKGWSAIQTVRQVSPYTLLWICPFVALAEGSSLLGWLRSASLLQSARLLAVLSSIGASVFVLLWSEYELVRITSSLTVSVAFVLKEVLVIFAGALIFNDRLSWQTCIGFVIVQGGMIAYVTQNAREFGHRATSPESVLGHDSP